MSAEPSAVLRSLRGQPIPLQGVDLSARAEGLLFELTVEQRYANLESEAIEAIYTFPLPLAAVLLSFDLQIGERRMTGTVTAKREASEQYEQAVQSGDAAALLEEAADGLYTVNLGNLKPGETAVIRYRYAQLLAYEQGRLRLAIPTAVAPRYGRAELAPHQVPEADLTVRYPCTLRMELRGALARARISSPSHGRQLHVATGDAVTLVSSARAFSLDRDLIVLVEGLESTSQAVLARDGEGYVAIASLVAPKAATLASEPRALKLVVDCSGSMQGDSIAQAREALLALLHGLNAHDHVSLTRFGTSVEHLTQTLEPATHATLARLAGRVRAIEADLSGTEMQSALHAVLQIPTRELRADVLLITDGEIWDVEQTIEAVAQANHRLFVVAVGAAPNEALARKIADATGGACEFVTPHEDVRAAVGRLLARMGTPPVVVAHVDWPVAPTWTLVTTATVFPGDTFHVLAAFDTLPTGAVGVVLSDFGSLTCTLPGHAAAEDTLARIAAMRRLKTLPRAEAAALAERYQLVTEYTSCVVVLERAEGEKTDGMPALRTVPQELAAGWGGTGSVHACVRYSASSQMSLREAVSPDLMESAPRPALQRRTSVGEELAAGLDDGDDLLDIPAFLRRERSVRTYLERIAELLSRGNPLPTTFAELHALAVPDAVLQRLATLVRDGLREDEVVTAWLALQAKSELGARLSDRQRRRLSRAADAALVRRVAEALADLEADEIPF